MFAPVVAALVLVWVSLCCCSLARAQSSAPLEVTWDAPPSCPQQQAIVAAVRRWLDQMPEPLDASQVAIDGLIQPEADGFVLDLALESASGHSRETLRARRCETLVDVVALKVMLAATPPEDPRVPARKRVVRARRARTRPARRLESPAAVEPSDDRAERRLRWVVALRGAVAFGLLPRSAPGVDAALAIQWSRLRLGVGITYHTPVAVHYAELPATGADIQLLAGGPHACFVAWPASVELSMCAAVELGVMRGTGFGVPEAFHSDQVWTAARFGPTLRVPLTDALGLAIEAQALATFTQPSYLVRYLDPLYRAGRWGLRAVAGLELRF